MAWDPPAVIPKPPLLDEDFKIMNTEIKDVIKQQARKEAHPGDTRRLMGKKTAASEVCNHRRS